jgi:hypothetical protein
LILVIILKDKLFDKKINGVEISKSNYVEIFDIASRYGQSDPQYLQEFLKDNLKEGVNDEYTKSAAYWIAHRYFDNGGNVYEIKDFIDKTPELSFMIEASNIYPNDFKLMEEGKADNYSRASMMVFLAYLETLDNNNLLGLPGLSTLANKYADMAYLKKDSTNAKDVEFKEMTLARSKYYKDKLTPKLENAMNGDLSEFATNHDAVVGINQYAQLLQTYKGFGIDLSQDKYTAEQVFAKAAELSAGTSLDYFVNWGWAVSYLRSDNITYEKILKPLSVIVSSPVNRPEFGSVLYKIINSKSGAEVGYYTYDTVNTIARYSPELKVWLKANGWVDADFR